MAVTEDISAYSTTQSSNTPAGSDNIGPDLDNHLRNIKKNVRRAMTSRFGERIADVERLAGSLFLENSASPNNTLNYDSGIGLYPFLEINESSSAVNPLMNDPG